MLGKLIPLLIALVGLGGGLGAGLALRPAPEPAAAMDGTCPCDCDALAQTGAGSTHADSGDDHAGEDGEATTDFVKMNNQFVVPVVKESDIAALVVLSISFEVPVGGSETIYKREPKLRDRFLQVLFDHANTGGFDGAFTAGPNMEALRTALLETARHELGNNVHDILITDIARQDM
ncbi:MAG TPA: flagellar basal body-associated protein FliL [Rhodobacteraceae bacterium]|nr:flagellar basal body-associated protein FliL [Paracoccaceae bacterium]